MKETEVRTTIEVLQAKVEALEKRVSSLEARPHPYPYYYPDYTYRPFSPYSPTWFTTSSGSTAGELSG